MLRFSLQLSLFLLVLGLAVMLIPVKRKRQYQGLANDCFNHASWLHQRLFENPAPVELAFIGSSHTINAIDDEWMETELNTATLNLGYCRHGRNLDYILAREVIQQKQARYLVVEVRARESKYSHPIFPYLASNRDLLSAYPWFNQNWFSDFSTAFRYRLQLLQETLWQEENSQEYDRSRFGYRPHSDTLALAPLMAMKQKRQQKAIRPDWQENFEQHFALHYIDKLASLAQDNKVKLLFLYLPAYGVPQMQPNKTEELRQYAPVLLPPAKILDNPHFWHDENHLNRWGAQALSEWLARELQDQGLQ